MDNRSFWCVMHKSVDSPLTGRLPTSCPLTYTQRSLQGFLMEYRWTGYPQPPRLLLLSFHSGSEDGALTDLFFEYAPNFFETVQVPAQALLFRHKGYIKGQLGARGSAPIWYTNYD